MRPEFDEQHQSKTHELAELSSTKAKDTKLKPKMTSTKILP